MLIQIANNQYPPCSTIDNMISQTTIKQCYEQKQAKFSLLDHTPNSNRKSTIQCPVKTASFNIQPLQIVARTQLRNVSYEGHSINPPYSALCDNASSIIHQKILEILIRSTLTTKTRKNEILQTVRRSSPIRYISYTYHIFVVYAVLRFNVSP